jgi:hypothetical protein
MEDRVEKRKKTTSNVDKTLKFSRYIEDRARTLKRSQSFLKDRKIICMKVMYVDVETIIVQLSYLRHSGLSKASFGCAQPSEVEPGMGTNPG